MAQVKPEVLDKLDADRWADVYADMLGVDPELVLSDEQVDAVRQQRAQAQQQAAAAEQAKTASEAVRNLGSAPTGQNNALTDVMSMFSGYNSPSPTQV